MYVMYLCINVYIYIYMFTHIHTHTYLHTYIHIHTYIYIMYIPWCPEYLASQLMLTYSLS